MLSARPAEWLIARFTGETRAASIVGDLLEDLPERGAEWFWFSVVAIVLSLTWRYLFALAIGMVAFQILQYLQGRPGRPQPHVSWWPFFAEFCMVLWVAAPYAAVRFGLRDRFAQLALFICLILSTAFIGWRMPVVLVAALGLGALLVSGCLALGSLRKVLLSVSLTLALGYFTTQFAFVVGEKYLEWMPPSVSYSEQAEYLELLLLAAFIAAACELMHRIFCSSDQRSSAKEQTDFSE